VPQTYIYTFHRRAIIEEQYEVEAESEEQAVEMMFNGEYGDPVYTEFVDWDDDGWEVTGRQEVEQLTKFIKSRDETPA
jgi:IMP cyclohydrolase